MAITIYHNPRCSKSRQTLAKIQEAGHEPRIIEYLKEPPTPKELHFILAALGCEISELLRQNESDYREHFSATDDEATTIELLSRFPKVLQRPIVVKETQAVIGRPPENVEALL